MENREPLEASADSETLADPLIGMVVDGRYRVEKLLARGGMATVFLAYDERLDRPVAFKIMHPHLAESVEFVNRFRREARAAAKILHPAVVSVFDQGVVAGSGYLVMEYVPGQTLRDELSSSGALSVRAALDYTESILQALSVAHSAGIIHRDIKPENVLVVKAENSLSPDVVKVADFGLARAVSDVSSASTGSVMGTVAYLAPEIVAEVQPDHRCDLYSLGIVLFEMLTGRTPFDDRSAIQIALAHVSEEIPAPSSLERWLPAELDDFVCSLSAREVAERIPSADVALEALDKLRRSLPPSVLERKADVKPVDGSAATTVLRERGETISLPREQFPVPAPVGVGVSESSAEPVGSASASIFVPEGAAQAVSVKKPRRRGLRVFVWVLLLLSLLGGGGAAGTWWYLEHGPGSYRQLAQLSSLSYKEATAQLQALDLKFEVSEEFSDTVAAGVVISTDPATPGPVHKKSTVKLVVSKGVEMVTVPELVNLPLEEAKTKLTEAKLSLGEVSEQFSESVEAGKLISISPGAGESVKHDSSVNLVVSKGREPISVPDLANLSRTEAEAKVTEAKLIFSVTEEFNDSVEAGYVISQAPAAGETLHRGDSVSFVVSKGPELREVPNVIGKNVDEAKQILEAAGFVVETKRIFITFGLVANQSVPGGTKLKVGSTITLSTV